MTATWLAAALRARGLQVVEHPGWLSRGTGGKFDPIGVLCHHTAGSATGDLPSLRIVRDGRAGLAGPLSQLMLSRSGVFHVIAAGRANHAGAGSAKWVPGNDGNRYLIGIEAESSGGAKDDWTAAQRAAYPRGVAALCRWMNVGANHVIGHKEWAPTRKVDPAHWDMGDFRSAVTRWLSGATPIPQPPTEEDDMSAEFERDVRKMWSGMAEGGLAKVVAEYRKMEKDLRGDLAAKGRTLDELDGRVAALDDKLDKILALLVTDTTPPGSPAPPAGQ